jgi:hypothetical protein
MRIRDVMEADQSIGVDTAKLIALSRFIMGRAQDTGTEPTMSLQAFLSMANNMKIGVTKEQLSQLVSAESKDPQAALLRNYIVNVTPDTVVFRGGSAPADLEPANPNQSQAIVSQMAQRAMK